MPQSALSRDTLQMLDFPVEGVNLCPQVHPDPCFCRECFLCLVPEFSGFRLAKIKSLVTL